MSSSPWCSDDDESDYEFINNLSIRSVSSVDSTFEMVEKPEVEVKVEVKAEPEVREEFHPISYLPGVVEKRKVKVEVEDQEDFKPTPHLPGVVVKQEVEDEKDFTPTRYAPQVYTPVSFCPEIHDLAVSLFNLYRAWCSDDKQLEYGPNWKDLVTLDRRATMVVELVKALFKDRLADRKREEIEVVVHCQFVEMELFDKAENFLNYFELVADRIWRHLNPDAIEHVEHERQDPLQRLLITSQAFMRRIRAQKRDGQPQLAPVRPRKRAGEEIAGKPPVCPKKLAQFSKDLEKCADGFMALDPLDVNKAREFFGVPFKWDD